MGSGVVCLCPRACRDGRSADRIKVIEVNAGAKETTRCPMNHVPVDVVCSKQNIPGQLTLHAYIEVLSLSRREVMRVNRPKGIGLFRKQDLWVRSRTREFGVLLCPERRKLREERAVPVGKRKALEEGGVEGQSR